MGVSQTLTLEEVSHDDNANTSIVQITWKSTQTNDSRNYNQRTASYWISFNGGAETRYSVSYILPRKTTTTILSTNVTVEHKTDGTGSITVRTRMDTDISAGIVELNKSLTLTQIPRNAAISSASNITLGNPCEIKWTPNSTGHKFKIRFILNGYDTGYGAGKNSGGDFDTSLSISPKSTSSYTYTGFNIPLSVANQFTKSKTASMIVRLATYDSGGKQVGGVSEKKFTVSITPDMKPTISDLSISADNSSISDTNLKNKLDALKICIAPYSKINLAAAATGSYSSTITKFKISGFYNTEFKGTSLNYSGDIVTSSGTKNFKISAIDSRGVESDVQTISIDSYLYSKPYVKNFTAIRTEEDPSKVKFGAYCYCESLDNKNSINSVTVYYKSTSDTSWSDTKSFNLSNITIIYSRGDKNLYQSTPQNINFEINTSYDFKVKVEDKLFRIDSNDISIGTEYALLDFKAGGHGLGVGKMCETDKLEVGLPSVFYDRVAFSGGFEPEIISDGTNIYNIKRSGIYVGFAIKNVIDQDNNGNNVSSSPIYDSSLSPCSFLLEVLPIGTSDQIMQRMTVFTERDINVMCYRFKYEQAYNYKCSGWKEITPRINRSVTLDLNTHGKCSVERYYCTQQGSMCNLYARLKLKSATPKNTDTGIAKLSDNSIFPSMPVATMGWANKTDPCVVWFSNSSSTKAVYIRSSTDLATGSSIEFNITWDINANWIES